MKGGKLTMVRVPLSGYTSLSILRIQNFEIDPPLDFEKRHFFRYSDEKKHFGISKNFKSDLIWALIFTMGSKLGVIVKILLLLHSQDMGGFVRKVM